MKFNNFVVLLKANINEDVLELHKMVNPFEVDDLIQISLSSNTKEELIGIYKALSGLT